MSKVVKLLNTPVPKGSLAVVPIGMYMNKALQKAQSGAVIEFQSAWRKDKRVLRQKVTVKINSPIFSFMARAIYGQDTRMADIIEQWRANCIIEGLGKDAFGDECLLIEVGEYDPAKIKIEQEAKRKAKEKAEREKMVEDARRGVFSHKDIL
jgi:hypothetical protein